MASCDRCHAHFCSKCDDGDWTKQKEGMVCGGCMAAVADHQADKLDKHHGITDHQASTNR